jgi:hypothetical protein
MINWKQHQVGMITILILLSSLFSCFRSAVAFHSSRSVFFRSLATSRTGSAVGPHYFVCKTRTLLRPSQRCPCRENDFLRFLNSETPQESVKSDYCRMPPFGVIGSSPTLSHNWAVFNTLCLIHIHLYVTFSTE